VGQEECWEAEAPDFLQVDRKSIEWLERQACHLLLGSHWVLIGAALVLQYHATIFWQGCAQCGKYGGKNGSPWLRTFGRQLIILQFYHCKSPWLELPNDDPVIWSMGVVLADVYFMKFFAHCLRWLQGGGAWSFWPDMKLSEVSGQKVIKSAYMDFSQSFGDIALLALCQASLFIMFYMVINTDEDTHEICNGMMLQWILSVAVILQSGLEEAGDSYQAGHWLATREGLSASGASFTWIAWWLRRSFDFAVNSLFREALLGIVPILLCIVHPLDLVKDVVAIFFICQLDQLQDPMSIDDMIAKNKRKRSPPFEGYVDTED
jgi:hypothetical protein